VKPTISLVLVVVLVVVVAGCGASDGPQKLDRRSAEIAHRGFRCATVADRIERDWGRTASNRYLDKCIVRAVEPRKP
jgi:uncharacterized lipoprotein